MKVFLKGLINGIIKMFQFIIFLIRLLVKTDVKNHIPSIEKGTEKKLFILANGPSLKSALDKIDFGNTEISVLNDFYKSSEYKKLRPRYYVLADPIYFEDKVIMDSIIQNVDWNMTLFVPYYFFKRMKLSQEFHNKNVSIVPYHINQYKGYECMRHLWYKKGLAMPRPQNVLVASIFTSINMGYKEIFLYGVDHSWTQTLGVNDENQVCAVDSHFYDKESAKFTPYNSMKMHELLRAFAFMFESYHFLRKYADFRGCRIVNCTKGSFIDAFERA